MDVTSRASHVASDPNGSFLYVLIRSTLALHERQQRSKETLKVMAQPTSVHLAIWASGGVRLFADRYDACRGISDYAPTRSQMLTESEHLRHVP